jgi:hypothetical protein
MPPPSRSYAHNRICGHFSPSPRHQSHQTRRNEAMLEGGTRRRETDKRQDRRHLGSPMKYARKLSHIAHFPKRHRLSHIERRGKIRTDTAGNTRLARNSRHRACACSSWATEESERPEPEKLVGSFHRFSGCSSPINQPVAFSVFIGSGRSQSKHWNVRGPSPPGGSARIKNAPQCGHVGRSAWPIRHFAAGSQISSIQKRPIPKINRQFRTWRCAYCFCSG